MTQENSIYTNTIIHLISKYKQMKTVWLFYFINIKFTKTL